MKKNVLQISIFLVLFTLYSNFFSSLNENSPVIIDEPPFLKDTASEWVKQKFNSLTEDEKIAQLFMIAAYSNKGQEHINSVVNLVQQEKVGGIIFFQGGPMRQAQQTNLYQSLAKIPLFIAIDGEWGLNMRLDSTPNYPKQMTLGAIDNEKLIYDMGCRIAYECKRIGVNINFAPVVDVNNNSKNPVINYRSFGERRWSVYQKGIDYMRGLQDNFVLATAKHFPGHGDTDTDSHKSLPVISHTKERLDSIELFPFKNLINNGLGAMMVAHLNIPALDSAKNSVSSISKKIINDLLLNNLNFKGLVFTDAMNMQGLSQNSEVGSAEVQALMAGVDVILMSGNVKLAISKIKKAIEEGKISKNEINRKCKKILAAKKWLGLNKFKPVELKNLKKDLNSQEAELLRRKLIENSITLLQNRDSLIPFKHLDSVRIASVSVGTGNETFFQKTLSLYDNVKHFYISKSADFSSFSNLISHLSKFDIVVVGIHKTSQTPSEFGITKQTIDFVNQLSKKTKVVLDIFGNPYGLLNFKEAEKLFAIVISYEDTKMSQDLSAQLLFGGISASGRLPVSAGENFPAGTGISAKKIRLKYSIPKEFNIDEFRLKKVDSIIKLGIEKKAFPGCQILVVKDGIVFYHKSFGFHTYEKTDSVRNENIYDLASITKIAATTPAIMKLYEEKKIDIAKPLSEYLPDLKGTNKKNITVKEILLHEAGLKSYIPLYINTYDKHNNLNTKYYSTTKNDTFCVEVAENLFFNKYFLDTLYYFIYKSPLNTKKYLYSDLGFFLFYKTISELTKTPLENYVENQFYNSLGATTLCYHPLQYFEKNQIIPTEIDSRYRKQLLQGYVHDFGAALLGCASGHAGLFSNANDLAKLMQMFLQKGEYGGIRYFKPETIELFTAKNSKKSRRGLGFDKPSATGKSPVGKQASLDTYGHTGFTGTSVWVDPDKNAIFIFLSNRVNPVANNSKMIKMGISSKLQNIFFEALK